MSAWHLSALGRTAAFAACFRDGRSWRSPHVPGPTGKGSKGSDMTRSPRRRRTAGICAKRPLIIVRQMLASREISLSEREPFPISRYSIAAIVLRAIRARAAISFLKAIDQYALDSLGLPARAIAFQSSNAWDAHGAADFGMRVVWCNRYGQRRERLPGAPDFEIKTLAELPGLLAKPA